MTFGPALRALDEPNRARVELHFTAWSSQGGEWAQIAINVRSETALPEPAFVELLQAFACSLGETTEPQQAWTIACRTCHFRGAVLLEAARPKILGRAVSLETYAWMVAKFSGLTPAIEERLLRQYAGVAVPGHRLRTLRGAPLGAYVQWATFDSSLSAISPFANISHTTAAVRTSLGLWMARPTEVLALVAYQCTPDLSLHRPTIAEAGAYSWYRPHHEADHPHGYTCALDTGGRGLPEVVHRPVTGRDIVLPYHLTTPEPA